MPVRLSTISCSSWLREILHTLSLCGIKSYCSQCFFVFVYRMHVCVCVFCVFFCYSSVMKCKVRVFRKYQQIGFGKLKLLYPDNTDIYRRRSACKLKAPDYSNFCLINHVHVDVHSGVTTHS